MAKQLLSIYHAKYTTWENDEKLQKGNVSISFSIVIASSWSKGHIWLNDIMLRKIFVLVLLDYSFTICHNI